MLDSDKIIIALDCFGGDNAPSSVLEGMALFFKRKKHSKINIKFLLFGNSTLLEKELKKYSHLPLCYEIIHTDKKISSEEKPSIALRRGKDSSMWKAIESVKEKRADACISAGNTGALMAISKLLLRTLSNVDRPALIQIVPAQNNNSVAMLDMGANIDCTSGNLYQFAMMGSIFYSAITGKEKPRIGLLNVGSEDLKGNDVVKHTAVMLKESSQRDNFYGFVEGNDIFRDVVDVVVTDGFTGNVALKTIEGTVKFIVYNIKNTLKRSILGIFGCIFLIPCIRKFKKKINPESYNGALFIGLNGISVKSHGNATGEAFYCAIENTLKLIKSNINEKIISSLNETELEEGNIGEEW